MEKALHILMDFFTANPTIKPAMFYNITIDPDIKLQGHFHSNITVALKPLQESYTLSSAGYMQTTLIFNEAKIQITLTE